MSSKAFKDDREKLKSLRKLKRKLQKQAEVETDRGRFAEAEKAERAAMEVDKAIRRLS